MGKMRRYFEKGVPYFVTTVTNNRVPVFIDNNVSKILLITIEYFKLILDYKIYAYCLMPDHAHLIIHPIGKYNLSYIMQMIKGSFSRKINKSRGVVGNIWQKRYYDEGIRNAAMLMQKIEYIHNNPLRKNLVSSAEDYPYSSFHFYFSNKADIVSIDRCNC